MIEAPMNELLHSYRPGDEYADLKLAEIKAMQAKYRRLFGDDLRKVSA